jgi:hypothetical protein
LKEAAQVIGTAAPEGLDLVRRPAARDDQHSVGLQAAGGDVSTLQEVKGDPQFLEGAAADDPPDE